MHFDTINLERDIDTCIRFRRDSYFISFNTYEGFELSMRGYKSRMKDRIGYLPDGNCHLWDRDAIVGQTEMKFVEAPSVGYVSLLYLIKDYRSKGLGKLLHDRAIKVFTELGKSSIKLSVSISNERALSFYAKHGWKNLGPRPGKEEVYLMQYDLRIAS